MNLTILKRDVADKVKMLAYYTAESVKGNSGDVAAMAQMSDDDNGVFEDWLSDAATEVNTVIMRMWRQSNFTMSQQDVVFECYPPYSWVSNMDGELKRALTDFIAGRIAERWLAMFGIPAVNRIEELKMDIRAILSRREKPL